MFGDCFGAVASLLQPNNGRRVKSINDDLYMRVKKAMFCNPILEFITVNLVRPSGMSNGSSNYILFI